MTKSKQNNKETKSSTTSKKQPIEKVDDSKKPELNESDSESIQDESEDFEFIDLFVLDTNNAFKQDEIANIELPKFTLDNVLKNHNNISEKSTLVLTLLMHPGNSDLGLRIFRVIKEGFKKFNILFLNEEEEMGSKWTLNNPKIKAVDFGDLNPIVRQDPRTVVVEVEYDNISIDSETLS